MLQHRDPHWSHYYTSLQYLCNFWHIAYLLTHCLLPSIIWSKQWLDNNIEKVTDCPIHPAWFSLKEQTESTQKSYHLTLIWQVHRRKGIEQEDADACHCSRPLLGHFSKQDVVAKQMRCPGEFLGGPILEEQKLFLQALQLVNYVHLQKQSESSKIQHLTLNSSDKILVENRNIPKSFSSIRNLFKMYSHLPISTVIEILLTSALVKFHLLASLSELEKMSLVCQLSNLWINRFA